MYIKKKYGLRKNEADDDALTAEELFEQRKDAAAESIGRLEGILGGFSSTDKEADAAKLVLIDFIKAGVDNLVSAVEKKLGLKKNG